MKTLQRTVLAVFAIAITGIGQLAWSGPVGTDFVVDTQVRDATLSRVESLLASDALARELTRHGVDQSMVVERLQSLTSAELLSLEGKIDSLTAGEGVLGLIGAVFVVLLILELVGVTDVFKSI